MLDMKDVFYVIKVREDLYQIRMTFNYECIATANSLEEVLYKIKKLCERYGTLDNLSTAWRNSDIRPSKPDQIARYKKEFEDKGHEFIDDINNLFEAQKPKLLKKKVNNLITKTPKTTVVEKPVEKQAEPEIKPKLLKVKKKKILFSK